MKDDFREQLKEKFMSIIDEAYHQGYNEAKAEIEHSISIENVKYYDLNLPSGLLWSNPITYFNYGHKLAMFTYEEAMQLEIPTVEQFQELLEHCRVDDLRIFGYNCVKIGYEFAPTRNPYLIYNKGEGIGEYPNMFWLKSEPDSKHEAKTIVFDRNILHIGKHFIGFKLPIFLVKNNYISN